jgi:predicted nuclease of predicted toxin-antitoxin system
VKLLFDENPSLRLADVLADLFPGSAHVHPSGLGNSVDSAIWEYAKANGFTIVSKDSDFEERSVVFGSPPKIILLRMRNCTSKEVEGLLRSAFLHVSRFIQEDEETRLVLGRQNQRT